MATNLFSKAAAYRKKNKGMTMPEAVKAVSGKSVSGTKRKPATKRKKVAGTTRKATAPVRKPVMKIAGAKRKRRPVTGVKVGTSKSVSGIEKKFNHGNDILKRINRLETKLKSTRGKDARDFIIRVINAEHDKLDAVKRSLKKRA